MIYNIAQVPRRFVKENWGGIETVVLETSKGLIDRGHQTIIMCPNIFSDQKNEMFGDVEVKRYPYYYPYFGLTNENKYKLDQKGGNLCSFPLLKSVLKNKDLDLIHLHTGKRLGGLLRHAAIKKNIPYIITLHGGVYDVPALESDSYTNPTSGCIEWGKIYGWVYGSRKVLEDADAIICLNRHEYNLVKRKFPNKKLFVLENGVHTKRFKNGDGDNFRRSNGIGKNKKLLLNMARIDPQKNQLFLLFVLHELIQGGVLDIHLSIIGPVTDQEYLKLLESKIDDLNLNDNVSIIPGIDHDSDELVDAYKAADLFVLPSMHEPFGVSVLEAWASSVPVVTSQVGGLASLIKPDKNGVFININSATSSAEVIKNIIQDEAKLKSLSMEGCLTAEICFDWDVVTEKLLRIYSQVINSRSEK